MSDTPTPRTDKAIQRCACADYIIEPAFARQLERELAAAHERIRRLAEAVEVAVPCCEYLHHKKAHQHKLGEPCPVEELVRNARKANA